MSPLLLLAEAQSQSAITPGMFVGALVSIVLFMAVQLGTAVWWMSGQNTKMTFVIELLTELRSDHYRKTEAEEALRIAHKRIDELDARLREVETDQAARLKR